MRDVEKLKKILNDPKLYIESFIKIPDKEGKLIPFKLNELQLDFMQNISKYNCILKSRQLGFSTLACALSLYYACTQPNTECLLVSYSIDSATAIFERLKTMYYTIPEIIRPKYIRNSKKELKFDNGSRIIVATCGNKDISRGMTLKFVHLSEYAFWKDNAEKQLLAIEQALVPSGILIIESTANGMNWFNDLYFKAKAGENLYRAFFYNWYKNKTMFKKDYDYAVKVWKARHNNTLPTIDDLDDVEKDLYEKGATIEQIIWRRLKIQNASLDEFQQEYPSTDLEAFISTNTTVFDSQRIFAIEKELTRRKEKYIPLNKLVDLPAVLKNHYGKSFFIYHKPEQSKKFYIGVDVAEGLGGDRDYSVCVVLDKDGRECAMFRSNKLKPFEFAEVVNEIGKYYNTAFLVVEKQSGGHSVIERLRYTYYYQNMSKYKTYDERGRAKTQIGFDTNSKTKGIIVNDFREWFDKGLIQINSIELLEEMKTFVANDNGSYNAMRGRHDDIIMAFCLAIAGIKQGKWYV